MGEVKSNGGKITLSPLAVLNASGTLLRIMEYVSRYDFRNIFIKLAHGKKIALSLNSKG